MFWGNRAGPVSLSGPAYPGLKNPVPLLLLSNVVARKDLPDLVHLPFRGIEIDRENN
jgi:hypothetical protein